MTGVVNVNKAVGVSSAREVTIIKRLTHTPCGHMGTLDPMADGVLPIAVGNATRLFDYFLDKQKTYVATFCFGEQYDTLDTTGALEKSGGRIPTEDEILNIIPSLTGEIMQIPPKYSAKNVNGTRGYRLARRGVEFELPPKKVTINSVKLLGAVDERHFRFEIECGGGTYIRAIARDMAQSLGTYAAMSALTRTKSGVFEIGKSVATDMLNEGNIEDFIIPCDSVLPFKSIEVGGTEQKKLFNGVSITCGYSDGTYKLYGEGHKFYGLAVVNNGEMKVRTKLC